MELLQFVPDRGQRSLDLVVKGRLSLISLHDEFNCILDPIIFGAPSARESRLNTPRALDKTSRAALEAPPGADANEAERPGTMRERAVVSPRGESAGSSGASGEGRPG